MSKVNIINELTTNFPKFSTYIITNSIKLNQHSSKEIIASCFINFMKTDKKDKKEGSWDKSGNKTNFNQIQKMMNLGIASEVCRNQNSYAYLKLVDNTEFKIRKQDEFHYKVIRKIYKRLKKLKQSEIINELFHFELNQDEQTFYVNPDLIQIEKSEKTKDSAHFRTDMSINIKTNMIVIEYLEKQHDKEKKLDYAYEKYRAHDLMFNNKNIDYKIIHIAYYWEHKYNNKKYFKQFIDCICKKIIDYWDILNEDIYCMRKLTEIIGNKTLAEQMYKAHNNRNEPIVHLKTVESIINWKKESSSKRWYKTFIDRVNLQVESVNNRKENNNNFDNFITETDSESESDSELYYDSESDKKITHENYYKIIDKEIYLTHTGLHLYINVEYKFLAEEEWFKITDFYDNITQGLINILKDLRYKESELKKDYISGLDY
jgi:hypothetical protein